MLYVFWILYFTGWALHLWAQAQASVKSSSNGLSMVRQWMFLNLNIIIVRAFLAAMVMLLWKESPDLFGGLVGRSLPMTKATCGIMGFGIDSALDKLTFLFGLKVEIPHIAPPPTATAMPVMAASVSVSSVSVSETETRQQ